MHPRAFSLIIINTKKGLVAVQLAITAATAAAFVLSRPAQSFVAANPWTLWLAMGASLALLLALSCSESLRRTHPANLICLFSFTACEALLVGVASAAYSTNVVLLAAGITAAATAALALYALQTKRDFTASGGILFSLLFAMLAAGVLSIFLPRSRGVEILLSGAGAALFSAYIAFDVQQMAGGGRASVSPDEYVFAALNLYLDV